MYLLQILKMAQLIYNKIRGKRRNASLLWIPQDKYLYVRHREHTDKSKGEDWICYQTILHKKDKSVVNCSSAVNIKNEMCTRKNVQNPHTNHNNHQIIYNDLITLNNIKDNCIAAKQLGEGLSMNISTCDIFTREIAK